MHAVQAALRLFAHPNTNRDPGTIPLPHGMLEVLKLAAGSTEALGRWSEQLGVDEKQLSLAAVFFVEQALMARHASHYRVLGLEPDATDGQIRVHYRWLMHWLHPDKHTSGWHRDLAERVNRAYHELRNPFRRAKYDATLGRSSSSPAAQSAPSATSVAPSPVPRHVPKPSVQPTVQQAPEPRRPVALEPAVRAAPPPAVQPTPRPPAQTAARRASEGPTPAMAEPIAQPTRTPPSPPPPEVIAEPKAQLVPRSMPVTVTGPTPEAPRLRRQPARPMRLGRGMLIVGAVVIFATTLVVLRVLERAGTGGVAPVAETPAEAAAPRQSGLETALPPSAAPEPDASLTAAVSGPKVADEQAPPPSPGVPQVAVPARSTDRVPTPAAAQPEPRGEPPPAAVAQLPRREPVPSLVSPEPRNAPLPAAPKEETPPPVVPPAARDVAQRFGRAYASGDLATVVNLLAGSGSASAQELSAAAADMDRWRSQHGAAPLDVSRLEPVPTDDGAARMDAVLLAPGNVTLRLRLRETDGTWKVERLEGVEPAP